MPELKPGDVIKVKKEHMETVESLRNGIADARCALMTAGMLCRAREKELFKAMRSMYPQSKGWQFSVNNNGIVVTRKMTEHEEEIFSMEMEESC